MFEEQPARCRLPPDVTGAAGSTGVLEVDVVSEHLREQFEGVIWKFRSSSQ
ncbi:hypothetical protein [Streptomyces sp. OV198]|jgi:hypothetical protein|uniref:hypothetical protein n=1 Tax=Streptomyces sp. OV198 TaxID=1882787 RepID=UPI0015CF7BBD|nr:hypothetical protein [Streptomyces sp. OV198]